MPVDDPYDATIIHLPDGTSRRYRSLYPADEIVLPPKQEHLQDPYQWRTNIISRLWIDDLGRPAVSESELRDNSDSHWVWCGALQSDGRAVVRLKWKVRSVPRVLWTMFRSGSPDTRKVAKRVCAEQGCVNPWHHELRWRGAWQSGTSPQVRH